MNPSKMVELQQQMRQNQTEMKESFTDLDSWLSDIKGKEENLKANTKEPEQNLPPVRNSLQKKKKKKTKKKTAKNNTNGEAPKKISGYDFRAWDKFDVNEACDAVDNQPDDSSSEYETDEEWEELRMKQQATMFKDQGNQLFKEGRLDESIECYTRGIQCDPYNALLPANRAMALLKQDKYGAAELDCSASITLDPTYVKSYQRRGTARKELKKYEEAKVDFQRVISLDPKNKLAKAELEKLDKLLNPPKFSVSSDGEAGVVKPIHKAPEQRSQKPLHRLVIEEVGDDDSQVKGESRKNLSEKDIQDFEKFVKPTAKSSPQVTQKQTPDMTAKTPAPSVEISAGPTSVNLNKSVKTNIDSPVVSPSTSPRIPPAPTTPYQFQADWKTLNKNTDKQFYEYFKEIPPKSLPKLFGQFLDADSLMKILHTLEKFYVPNNGDVASVLQQLAMVKRFDMTVMFFSSKDKKIVMDLLKYVGSKCDPGVVKELKQVYKLE